MGSTWAFLILPTTKEAQTGPFYPDFIRNIRNPNYKSKNQMGSVSFLNEKPDKLRHKASEATRSLIASPYLPARVKKRNEREI